MLSIARYPNLEELRVYCTGSPAQLGWSALRSRLSQPALREYAIDLGLALQMTNIIRTCGRIFGPGHLLPRKIWCGSAIPKLI